MNTLRPKSRLAPAMLVAGVLCAAPGIYVGGYLSLCWRAAPVASEVQRVFHSTWQARVFIPAAAIEAKAKGVEVELWSENGTVNPFALEQVRVLSP